MLVVDEAELLFSFANLGGEGTCVLGSRCGNAVFIGLLQLLCEESSGRVVLELVKTMGVAERTLEPHTFYIQKAGVDEEGSMRGRGEYGEGAFDGENDEAVELALLCLCEVDDRKAVGDDRMDLCLDQFTDQGHGGRVSSPNDTTDAMHCISYLWEDGIEMSIPPTVLFEGNTEVADTVLHRELLIGEGEVDA